MERFERFRFSVPAVPRRRGVLCVSVQFSREDGSGSGFGSWGKRFRRFRFRVRFLGKRSRRFRFPVPVRFLGHPEQLFQGIITEIVSARMVYHCLLDVSGPRRGADPAAAQPEELLEGCWIPPLLYIAETVRA